MVAGLLCVIAPVVNVIVSVLSSFAIILLRERERKGELFALF